MVTPLTQKFIAILVALSIVIWLGYGLYNAPSTTKIPDQGALLETDGVSQEILGLVDKLTNTSIDQSIFSSPLFTKLIDISVAIIPEVKGRPNPFAPIGTDPTSGVFTKGVSSR